MCHFLKKDLNPSNVPLNHLVPFHVAQEHLIILHLLCFCDPSSHPDLGFRFCLMKKETTFHLHVFFYFLHIFCFSLLGSWEGCWFIAGALSEHLGVWSSKGILPYRPSNHQPCINTNLPNKKLVDVHKCYSTERDGERE